jgi:5-methylthioadenosine/S-adenosylhomocysteine deaminase
MASTLIHGKYVVTSPKADGSDVLTDGAILEEDGFIRDVGTFEQLRQCHPEASPLGGSGYIVLPGLVNAHHHGNGLSPLHMGIPDSSLERWIIQRIGMKVVDVYLSAAYAAIKLIQSGTTTVMLNQSLGAASRMEEDAQAMLGAFRDAGLRVCYSLGYRQQNRIVYADDETFLKRLPAQAAELMRTVLKAGHLPSDDYFRFYDRLIPSLAEQRDRVRVALSPSNLQWCSDDFLREVKAYASSGHLPIHMHLLETFYQKEYAFRTFGKSAVKHLADMQFLGPDVSIAHAVWLTEADIGIVAKSGTQVCHNASSNLKLQSGIAPVQPLLAQGATVALGTDSMALNDDEDLFQDMRLVTQLHRNSGLDSTVPTADQVLTMATVNGAQATGFEGEVGRLLPGYRADIVLLRLDRISQSPIDSVAGPVEALVYLASGRDVDTVIIGGQVVVRDGRVTSLNREEVTARLKEDASREPSVEDVRKSEIIAGVIPHIEEFYKEWGVAEMQPHYRFNTRA